MECNKDAAKTAMDIAERKLSEKDYVGAKKFSEKAQSLYPNLEGLKQVLMMIDVYMIGSKKINGTGDSDWYGILGVDPLADDEAVKKQYKKLALLLHPDKNKCKGAEEAFKLVSEAWCLLSDKVKRVVYDQKRKFGMQRPPNPQRSASRSGNPNGRPGVVPTATFTKPAPARKGVPFWTMCTRCKFKCTYLREYHLDKPVLCLNCGLTFIATETNPWTHAPPPPPAQAKAQDKATNKNTNGSLFYWNVCIGCKKQFTYTKPSSGLTNTISCPSCGKIFVVSSNRTPPVSTKKYTYRASSSWTPVTPKTPQASAKSQATNTNTNGASSSSSPTANATPQASAQDQSTNGTTETTNSWIFTAPSVNVTVNASEGAYPTFTVSTSSQPQQQNQSTGQNTSSGGTSSEAGSNTSSSSIKVTVNWNCSYKLTRNEGSTTFQAGGRPKRPAEESQENTAFKKPRTVV